MLAREAKSGYVVSSVMFENMVDELGDHADKYVHFKVIRDLVFLIAATGDAEREAAKGVLLNTVVHLL